MAKDKKSKDEIVVYWGPPYRKDNDHSIDWNMFYPDPEELLPEFKKDRIKEVRQNSLVYCPAFNDNYKNTFLVRNVVDSKFTWNDTEKMWEIPTKFQVHPALGVRMPYMENRMALITGMVWLFASEEPLEMEVIPPYMHQTEASKYGVVVSGKFDIGSWYRPVMAEYLLWEGVDRLQIKEDDPYFYIRFNTDKKVVLKRFANNEDIYKHTVSIVQTKYIFGKLPALDKLYRYFAKTKTKQIMLQKIKNAVIEE